jgi:hypothetical protein
MFIATTCITISSATTDTNALGDTEESWAMVDSDVAAHLAESRRVSTEPGTGVLREVRYMRLLCPPGTVLADGWRVQDQTDDTVYVVVHVEGPARRSPIGYEMVTADLERVA